MDVNEVISASNLPALGRFKPCHVSFGDGQDEISVKLKTNLAGEPIRFSFNEDLSNIVSSGTLTLLNAQIDEITEIQTEGSMLYDPEGFTEEDEAQWGVVYDGASVEPNQIVYVWEIRGGFTSNFDEDEGITMYEADEESEICLTKWRVVSFCTYVNEEDVPYCDVELESYPQIAIETKVDPKNMGSLKDFIIYYDKEYYDSLIAYEEKWKDVDEVLSDASEIGGTGVAGLSPEFDGTREIIEDGSVYLTKFFELILNNGFSFTGNAAIELDRFPLERVFKPGESCWDVVTELLGINGKAARFTRAQELITWDINNSEAPLGNINVGAYGQGLKLSYSKEGVFSYAKVTGYIGEKDNETGDWKPDTIKEVNVSVYSQACNNILNGQKVEEQFDVDPDYLFSSEDDLKNWGQFELYKSMLSARGASVDSDSLPLNVEVGMKLGGTSSLVGFTEMLVTSFSRTTDAQEGVISASVSGTVLAIYSDEITWS